MSKEDITKYLNNIDNPINFNNYTTKSKEKGILYFHQDWTDIMNCLSFIDYYKKFYDELIVLSVARAYDLVNFYVKNKPNIFVLYHDIFQFYEGLQIVKCIELFFNNLQVERNISININDYDLLFHGFHDRERIDNYKDAFANSSSTMKSGSNFFLNKFYTCYDIDYMNRINCFNVNRDYQLENNVYNNFVKQYGTNYILYHEVLETEKKPNINYINLNKISSVFFDFIKVLENSIEFHVIDSVWADLIYLLDCKYKLFQNKKIYLYAKRNYESMFTEPILLDNWIIIKF